MRSVRLIVFGAAALLLAGCAAVSPQPGELQPYASACEKANEGLVIAVEGYLRLPDTLVTDDTVELHLFPDLSFTVTPIAVPVKFGDGPDQAHKITSSFHDEDLMVHLADGTLVPFGTKVRASGRMRLPVVATDYQCELLNVYLERAP